MHNNWGVVKYKPSAFFRNLCDPCMIAHAPSPSHQSKLFPKSSPNPNECTHESGKSACTLIHGSQRFRKKADGSSIRCAKTCTFAGWGVCGMGVCRMQGYPLAGLSICGIIQMRDFRNAGLNTALSKCGIAVLLTLSLV